MPKYQLFCFMRSMKQYPMDIKGPHNKLLAVHNSDGLEIKKTGYDYYDRSPDHLPNPHEIHPSTVFYSFSNDGEMGSRIFILHFNQEKPLIYDINTVRELDGGDSIAGQMIKNNIQKVFHRKKQIFAPPENEIVDAKYLNDGFSGIQKFNNKNRHGNHQDIANCPKDVSSFFPFSKNDIVVQYKGEWETVYPEATAIGNFPVPFSESLSGPR